MVIKLSKCFATVFYLGYFPFAAGSLATILGGAIALVLRQHPIVYFCLLFGLSSLGFITSAVIEQQDNQKDPAYIVIDEVVGAMIAFYMLPWNGSILITAFFLFRAFDMFKIAPAFQLQGKPLGVGVMMDDIIAGIYTYLVMQTAIWIAALIYFISTPFC